MHLETPVSRSFMKAIVEIQVFEYLIFIQALSFTYASSLSSSGRCRHSCPPIKVPYSSDLSCISRQNSKSQILCMASMLFGAMRQIYAAHSILDLRVKRHFGV